MTSVAAGELRQFVERAERLHEERKALAEDLSELFKEAKSRGYDTRALKEIIKLRARDDAEREEMEAIVKLYVDALGGLA